MVGSAPRSSGGEGGGGRVESPRDGGGGDPDTVPGQHGEVTQPWACAMYATASRTVDRFFTSSSGMRTLNFSSAFTTIVIIDSESMSRSSVKLLSSSTESTGR